MSRPLHRPRARGPYAPARWPADAAVSAHAQARWAERGGAAATGWDAVSAYRRARFLGHVPGAYVYQTAAWCWIVQPTRRGWLVVTVLDGRTQQAGGDTGDLAAWVRAHLPADEEREVTGHGA